jgi:hypothetical protein
MAKNTVLVETVNKMINSPRHYIKGRFEVIEVLEEWDLPFHLANSVKYIARYKDKGKPIEDLEKAVWYMKRWMVWKNKSFRESIAAKLDNNTFHVSEVADDWGIPEDTDVYKSLEYLFYGDILTACVRLEKYIEFLRLKNEESPEE